MARCVQALTPYFQSKITTGTEPLDVLHGQYLGISGQSTTVKDWRYEVDASNNFLIQENTGTDAVPVWVTRFQATAGGGGAVPLHATTHQHGGADEVATATPANNAIVKANGSGLLATGWLTGVIRNAEVSASAAIAYSKLNLATSIVNADVSASAAIVYSKLSLANSIVNADVNTAAAIAYSKLNLTGLIVNADIGAAAAIAYSKLNLTGLIVNADIGAAAAIAYSKLNLTGLVVNADIGAAAAIAYTKLAALTASRAVVSNASGVIVSGGGIREVLTAVRTYFVRSDGSDSNTGLVNNAGGAYLTLAKAISTVASLDLATFAVTIQIGNTGSYAGFTVFAPFVGGPGSSVTVIGDTAAASNYVITSTVAVLAGARITINGVDFTPSSGDGLALSGYAAVTLGINTFGVATGARQILVSTFSALTLNGVLTMDGSAANWILAVSGGSVSSNGIVHVFSGTPAYSSSTVNAQTLANISIVNGTPSGAATGTRYLSSLNAVIFTNGGGATFFPGNVGGTASSGSQYA